MRTAFYVVLNTINQLTMHQMLTRVSWPPAIPVDKLNVRAEGLHHRAPPRWAKVKGTS